MFKEIPVRYRGGTHRCRDPQKTIEKVEGKLRAAGVTRIAEITHLDRIGIPVYSAIRPGAAEGAVSIYAGKGATKPQAKASAMMEAFERYSAEQQKTDEEKNVVGSFFKMEGCIDPKSLILPSNISGADENDISWVTAIDAADDSECLVPANAVYHPYIPENGVSLFKSNTNGLASGNVIEEAVFHGITEVVERDAWSIFEALRQPKMEVNCEGTENQFIKDIISKFHKAGVEIKLVDLTADVKIPTMAAVSDDRVLKDPALLTLGVGTHLDPEVAAIRALTEVAQSRATQIHGTREDTTRAVFMRKAGYQRMKRINKHWFGESQGTIELSDIENQAKKSFREDIETSLNLLSECDFDQVLYTDLTRPEIDIPVVRVVIPGMEVYSVDVERVGKRLKR
ncbi:YcaO-related McrA-glycine thioamidation protein [Methanobacterium petrolearium]|uniref:YcaO-related McrA-glycine thioamidation protein n=1 Tax=Methanobacterium petrolearium TaxID=710190 RepID=UPI001AE6D52B|nr:YcaO-related McrA-glycine thioamidation protein [Methanobacterium petrolearium]MBP1945934.1 ribosomal protein S12 methylthiotransferase accessory factor [Methanobacterium petrolearium]BDZ69509.1 methanogenesis marker 1 protein [Methanobacterium petrolearium]BDZ72252.1 methanogenesis marker 1 protein [Methanobacterium petrolearium]